VILVAGEDARRRWHWAANRHNPALCGATPPPDTIAWPHYVLHQQGREPHWWGTRYHQCVPCFNRKEALEYDACPDLE